MNTLPNPIIFFRLLCTATILCMSFFLPSFDTQANQLSAGDNHTCVIDNSGVKCWGRNDHKQNDVPTLSNPTQVSAGGDHTCAIDDNGLTCWGYNALGQSSVPILSTPTQLTMGNRHTCVIDNNTVKCWGHNGFGQLNVPALSNPTQISAGDDHTCVLNDTGVVCWGWNGHRQNNVPALSNPRQITAGSGHTCALDNNGVTCWGWNGYGQRNVPALSNPTKISAGDNHTCAIDNGDVKCWGYDGYKQSSVPALSNPTLLSAGGNHTCALDNKVMKCWGWNAFGQTNVSSDLSFVAINGVCGSSHEKVFTRLPTTNLCEAGRSSHVIGTNPWTWRCVGVSGGSNASCSTQIEDNTEIEKRVEFIERFYREILNRVADPDGLDNWLDVIQTESAAKVALGFFDSQEFTNLRLNNDDFIYILYNTLFDREPDQQGLYFWMEQLEAGTLRTMIVYSFLRSPEFSNLANSFNITAFNENDESLFQINVFIDRIYHLVLNREPDEAGFKNWTTHISNGGSASDLARSFFRSPEFTNRQTTDDEFLDIVYHALFDREPDEAGKYSWLDVMASGLPREDVVDGFISSQEFHYLTRSFSIEN